VSELADWHSVVVTRKTSKCPEHGENQKHCIAYR